MSDDLLDITDASDPEPICEHCGTEIDVTWGVCPFAAEIHNDYTELWLCAECRYQSAMDI